MELKSGIYKITNIINDKFYIGSAVNIDKRRNQHLHNLRKGKHPNIHLQRSFDKHGELSFRFEILEHCQTKHLIEKEQYYIDTLKPHYNICQVAGNSTGRKATKDTKEKMSKARKGKKHTAEAKLKMSLKTKGRVISVEQRFSISTILSKPVVKLDELGNVLEEFNSVTEAITKSGVANICKALKGKYKTAGGFVWKYKIKSTC